MPALSNAPLFPCRGCCQTIDGTIANVTSCCCKRKAAQTVGLRLTLTVIVYVFPEILRVMKKIG